MDTSTPGALGRRRRLDVAVRTHASSPVADRAATAVMRLQAAVLADLPCTRTHNQPDSKTALLCVGMEYKGKGSPYSITRADPGSWQSACR